MKAITLTQPWATLVAIGAKRIETRSWRTSHRGPLLIHAAKAIPSGWTPFMQPAFVEALEPLVGLNEFGSPNIDLLPRGFIIAVAELVHVHPTERVDGLPTSAQELAFGDYGPGRYAWRLWNVRRVVPIPYTGHLGLFNAQVEVEIVEVPGG